MCRYIYLGDNNELLPVGVPGELCIGGAGLARGYLNREDLTAEKFVEDPFRSKSRIYKTGDLGSWTPDGNITYLGRKDEQVKIRGHRVELGEIESVLQENEMVKQAVVLARENKEGGSKRLVAYVVPEENFSKAEVKDYLETRLPEYMIPVQWMELESMPLTVNGKTDRKALPDPEVSVNEGKEYVPPRNAMEQVLAEIWQDLLEVDTVGIHDNFFELGGDSIIIIQIVSRARRAGFELQIADIFTHQTIARLSATAQLNVNKIQNTAGEQGILTGESGLLPIQQWFFENDLTQKSHFNQSVLLGLEKSVTEAELDIVLKKLTLHHDSLRFSYHEEDGKWEQLYGSVQGNIINENLSAAPQDSLSHLIEDSCARYQQDLDIEKGELLRMVFVQTPEEEKYNRLFIVIHHLVVDGVSWRILLEDISLLLDGLKSGEEQISVLKEYHTVNGIIR